MDILLTAFFLFLIKCTLTAVACDESKLHVMQYVLTCRIGVKKVYNVTPIICLFKVFLTKLNSICSKPVQSKQLLKLRLFINQGKMSFQNTWWWITGESFKFMVAQNVKLDFFLWISNPQIDFLIKSATIFIILHNLLSSKLYIF